MPTFVLSLMALTVLVAFTAYESHKETNTYADKLDQRIAQLDQQIANADQRMATLAEMQALVADLETDLSDLQHHLAENPPDNTTAVLIQPKTGSPLSTDKPTTLQALPPPGAIQ